MSTGEQIPGRTEPHEHLLHFYNADDHSLAKRVGSYLFAGSERGAGLLVIATAEHSQAFVRQLTTLGADPRDAIQKGRLIFLDAQETLLRFMVDGDPDWQRFQSVIGTAIHELAPGEVCAYGEMVGILWAAGERPAAIRLEEFWNRILHSNGHGLFCAYPIDIFDPELQSPAVQKILSAHTHFLPIGENGDLESAMNRALQDVGPGIRDPGTWVQGGTQFSTLAMPNAEATILSLRSKLPREADEILARIRHYYESEKRFRALVEHSSDAISLLDAQGDVQYATASSVKVLGYYSKELIGRNLFELIHPDDLEHATGMFNQALANARCPAQMQVRARRKNDQWCWIESTTTNLLEEPDVRAIVFNYRDISERKAAEEKLARSHAELQAFAYATTHDLKEPLRTISAFTQLLVLNAQLDEHGQNLARFVVEGVGRMSSLLDDLLSFTSLNFNDSPKTVELNRAVEKAIKNLDRAICESGAVIRVDPLPATLGNENRLSELFQNLISNAIKYRSEAPVQIQMTAEQLGHEWVVKVKDNGIGIPPEYHDQVFGLLKRLHGREISGTGIGLAICKKIVEAAGGRIWVDSHVGEGSTFCFTVPAIE